MSRVSTGTRSLAALFVAVALTGCHRNQTSDLQAFVQNAYKDHPPKVEPVPVMTPPQTFTYAAQILPDPFSPANLEPAGSGPRPDMNRRKDPLESFPLDALKMTGTLSQGSKVWAIIEAPDGPHHVRLGEHMGENYGTVTKITSNRVTLVELVPGPNGGWVSRDASISIGK